MQIGVLASGFRLSQAFPPDSDRAADQRLVAAARSLGGTVAIPADPGIAVTAGLPPTEDQVAAADVLRASDQSAKADLHGEPGASGGDGKVQRDYH